MVVLKCVEQWFSINTLRGDFIYASKIFSSILLRFYEVTEIYFFFSFKKAQYTVGKKSIRALEIFRVQKLTLKATS